MNQNNAIIVRAVSGHGFSSLSRSQTPPPSFFPRIKDDPTLFSVASHVSTNFSGPLSVSVYSPPSTLFVVHLHIKVITILLRHWDQDQISLRLHHPTLSGDPATYIIRSLGSTEPERTTMQTPSKWSSSTKKLGGWEVYVAQSVSVCVLIIPYPATHIYILYIYIFPFFCVWREI
jgi:hypothetical protein